jgi:hypothetical protein
LAYSYLDGFGRIVIFAEPFWLGSDAEIAVKITIGGFGTSKGAV